MEKTTGNQGLTHYKLSKAEKEAKMLAMLDPSEATNLQNANCVGSTFTMEADGGVTITFVAPEVAG